MSTTKTVDLIILVDDHYPTNLLHRIIIEESNIAEKIHEFTEPKKAIEYLKSISNDSFENRAILFLDINMPGMTGWEFLDEYDKIQKEKKLNIEIVMLSTSNHPRDLKMAEANQWVKDYIPKPLCHEALISTVERLLF